MKRDDLQFQLSYSYFMESMHARLYSRVDKLLTFAQLVLGSSVFASFGENWFLGLALVILSAISFVWQPAAKSHVYAGRADNYAKLMYRADELTDQELESQLTSTVEDIFDEVGALTSAAYMRAAIQLGRQCDTKLSGIEKVLAWLAGDLPRHP
ncbi:hypothetical protein [Pseudaeromonas paramecii]|uniref:SMODS and SLOG-associating 2TM effector domain-containing protein n=1 Tax=Pseudaeromonas paramecii TaxID=2138166 RepID=A0ABP8PWF0_9GAMM